jgi:hypothetical protein
MLRSYLKYKSNGCYIIQRVVKWPVCRSVVVPYVTTHYMIYRFVFQVTPKDLKKLPDDDRLLPKHVGAGTHNKGVVQISA